MRLLILIGILAAAAIAGPDNVSGYGDTSSVAGFRADSVKYSKWFSLSNYENLVAVCLTNDTGAEGFANDSVYFSWGIQYGDPVLNSNGKQDTAVRNALVMIDSMHALSANFALKYGSFDSTGTEALGLKGIDTNFVTGFMTQSRSIAPEWHAYCRFFAKGETGNNVSGFLRLRFAMVRRNYVLVRQQ